MANMELIEAKTLASTAGSVTFSTIAQTYTDLKILVSARDDRDGQPNTDLSLQVGYNGSINTGSIYSAKQLYGNGATAGSQSSATTYLYLGMSNGPTATANTFGNTEIYITNYTSANSKSVSTDGVSETNATTAFAVLNAGLISTSNPITDIKISAVYGSGNFQIGSTFYLYGISNVTSGTKATGGVVSTDGTYYYHMFPFSGTFTPTQSLTADYLVVAGGGSGGSSGVGGGGGGAGGMRCTVTGTGGSGSLETPLSLTAQAYAVTVGAGGAGVANAKGNNGSNSVFSTITSTGGGGGSNGASTGAAGEAGGSGGGGSGRSGTVTGGAASPSGQGFAGGNGVGTAATDGGGGGGGASAVGANAVTPTGGAGGAGRATSISGSSVTYAGGGGGGSGGGSTMAAGGAGGGGQGGADTPGIAGGTAGTVNTGGGSGGARDSAVTSTNGGSGIVIIRYAI
jgi:hypothetical protein